MRDTDRSKHSRQLVALLAVSIALLALCLAIPALAAANANFVGAWSPSTGQPWTVSSQDAGGGCMGTTSLSGFTFTACHVSGNEYEFFVDQEGSSYESRNHGTIEGNKLTGEFNDTLGHNVPYTAVREGGGMTVTGQVLDTQGKAAAGVTLTVTGTSDTEKAISQEAKSNVTGAYSIEVEPGTYTVKATGDPTDQNGGALEVATAASAPICTGTATGASCALKHVASGEEGKASFTYTMCGGEERKPHEKEPTGCPIIFIPGILGSRISCIKGEVYFALPRVAFNEIHLNDDGDTNPGAPGSCNATAHTPPGEEGLLTSVATEDVYGSIFKYLTGIGTNGVYAYPYDWRRSVPAAATGLSTLVDEVLKKSGAKHVVLVAHSMGGLVTQEYINTGSNADKVSRAVTIGTPYWGAPKSMISLLNGRSNEFATEKLDLMFGETALQDAVRNYLGLFWLYPSGAYGPWLQVTGEKFTGATLGGAGITSWVESLGGNPLLLASAESGHATLDTFKPKGVDYQIIVGTGLATITGMKIAVNEVEPEQLVSVTYGSGDGTVPAVSQTQGAFPGTSSPVGIHYVCDIAHSAEPAAPSIQASIKEFVLNGGAIPEMTSPCLFTGTEVVIYKTGIVGHGASASAVHTPTGATLSIEQAVAKGLVQVFEHGGQTSLVTDASQPVTLSLPAKNLTMRVTSLSSKGDGRAVYYGPVNGTVTIAGAIVSKGGRRLRAGKAAGAPHITATVSRHGKHFLVTLHARSRRGLRSIYYRLGKSPRRIYARPLRLSARQLKSLRFAGVSVTGAWERAQRARP
jgi:pimeloyl-ACP methyl ester carboxylesterase